MIKVSIKKIFNFSIDLFLIIWPLHLIMLITNLLPNTSYTIALRGVLVKPFFKKCGKNFKIASGVTINHPRKISIGDNVYIAHNNWFNAAGEIEIHDNVQFGPMCVVVTGKHIFENGILSNKSETSKIVIKENSWIASHVVLTDGVKIGKNVIIAAGSVVTKSIEDGLVVGGVPAKLIKKNVI